MRYEVCAQCGKQFKLYPSQEGRKRFCSKQCMSDERRGKPRPAKAGMKQGYRFPNVNTYRTDGDVSFVAMRDGIEVVIDTADLPVVKSYTWTPTYRQEIAHWYVITSLRREDGTHRTTYMHRLILNAPSNRTVDHINHNSLDNRRANLRLCTNSENLYNRRDVDPRSRTGIQGVSIQTSPDGRQYYLARVTVTKLYPFTEDGKAAAAAFAADLRQKVGVETFINAHHRSPACQASS